MAHILLIDDDGDIHRRVISWLIPLGHSIENVLDTSLADILLQEQTFDLIICDNNMRTVGEGLDFGTALWLEGSNIPFILHTSAELHELPVKNMEKFHITYVKKSYEPNVLIQKVNELLQAKNATP